MQSPPLLERLREMMNNSDNVMAESIGREVAAAQGKPQSFDGAVRAVLGELDAAKIDTGGAHADGLQRVVRRRSADRGDPR